MPTVEGIDFDRVVNAVDDLGADPSGNSDSSSAFLNGLRDGTLIDVPPGTYRVNQRLSVNAGGNIGIRGTSGNRQDVQFTIPGGQWIRVFNFSAPNILIKDVSLQQGSNFNKLISVHTNPGNYSLMKNVEWLGATPSRNDIGIDTNSIWQLLATTPSGATNEYDGIVKKGPTSYETYPNSSGFFWTGRAGASGTTIIRNWHLENSGESGIYAGKAHGPVHVIDSYFYNCAHSAVRVTGRDSTVQNSIIVIDIDNWHPENRGVRQQWRGLWCQSADVVKSGAVVTDSDFTLLSSPNTQGLIAVDNSNGGPLLRRCRIRNETGHPTISTESPDSGAGGPLEVKLEDCHLTGNGSGSYQSRPDSYIRDGCIDTNNQISSGYEIQGTPASSGCELPRLEFDSGGGTTEPPENQPPTATWTISNESPIVGEQVTFSASGSDSDGSIAGYSWTFGDGSSASGSSVSHSYDTAGSYTVTLVVEDNDGATYIDQATIDVREEGTAPPPESSGVGLVGLGIGLGLAAEVVRRLIAD